MISAPLLCVVNPLVPVPRAAKVVAGTGSLRGGSRCMGKEAVVVVPASFVFPLGMGASLVSQMVKNLPAIGETWVQSLGWEDSPGEGIGNPLRDSCLKNSMDRGAWWAIAHGVATSWM